jgi:hypothetical protein
VKSEEAYGASYRQVVDNLADRIREVAGSLYRHMGRLSVWIRFIDEELYNGSPVEVTQGSTTRLIFEAHEPEELITTLAENIVLKVFGEELRLTNGVPEIALKLFEDKYYLEPRGPYADHTTDLKLKVTVYEHRPNLFERLFNPDDV